MKPISENVIRSIRDLLEIFKLEVVEQIDDEFVRQDILKRIDILKTDIDGSDYFIKACEDYENEAMRKYLLYKNMKEENKTDIRD